MPLRYRNLIDGRALFFLSTSRSANMPFPGLPVNYSIISEILFRTAREKKVAIVGYVLMPTHVHLIIDSIDGGPGVSKFIHSFKGRVRETLQGKGKFWQDRFDDLEIRTQKHFQIKLNYIHYNPVRAGLVSNPEDWEYSSYNEWHNDEYVKDVSFYF